jgi:BirA family biotin operon repressor/biotin-[acetyl-CoA-carboxylase] ligase
VVIAEKQTAGRGRLGRSWQANPGENLTFSIVLRPGPAKGSVNLLPLLVAVAVADAVQVLTGLSPRCKWPNDLLLGEKKFAGILLEGALKDDALDYVVVGVGVNVNQTDFSADLADRATSLRLAAGGTVDREELFKLILERVEDLYLGTRAGGFSGILPLWHARSAMTGQTVSVQAGDAILTGIVTGVSPEGGLILNANGSEQTVYAGDVTVVGFTPGSLAHAPGH